jgi:outer membrane protein OmpA-like peptidoglycan-associated protein
MGNITHKFLPTQMKTIQSILNSFILFFLLLLPNFSYAQLNNTSTVRPAIPHEWEVGIFVGMGTIFGDVPKDNIEALAASKPAIGLAITRHLTQTLALRGSVFYANLKDSQTFLNITESRTIGYELKLLEFSGALLFEPLSERRRQEIGRFKKIISPYAFIGVGGNFGKPTTFYENIKITPNINKDNLEKEDKRANLLIGGGVKYDLSPKLSIGLEVGIRPTFNDLLDGISYAGNPDKNDWYGFSGLTVNYRIGEPDADGDGIVDAKDICPGAPGEQKFGGCPDTDGDGVKNSKDDCPNLVGSSRLNGCPDSDKDGTADHLDQCPNEKGMMRLNGCPDRDWDYVIDSKDECPDVPGKVELNGCPPLPDKIIVAAESAINAAELGQDASETTPESATEIQALFATVPDNSMAEIVEEEVILKTTSPTLTDIENIHFPENSNQFDSEAYSILTAIAKILPQYPNRILHISTYAEIDKNGVINQGIAGKRVFLCFKYLLQKGIPRGQLVYYNYKRPPDSMEENGVVIFELKE